MKEVFNNKLLNSVLVLLVGILIYLILKMIFSKILGKKKYNHKKRTTYIKLFSSIFRYSIILLVLMFILRIYGIDITSILAGLGVASVIAGLALQDALKDIIMGFNILVDGYFVVGDVVKFDDVEGKILEIGLKSTKMQDINNGNIYVLANRNISKSLVKSTQLDIDIPVSYNEKIENIESILDIIIDKIKTIKGVDKVEYRGLQKFGDSAIYYKIRIQAKPELQPQIKRDANKEIKLELDKNNIEIPYMQIDIHTK